MQHGLCKAGELVKVSNWAPGVVALVVEELGILKKLRVAGSLSILGKRRTSIMRIYGEFGTIARIFKCFGLLINSSSVASVSYTFEDSSFHGG